MRGSLTNVVALSNSGEIETFKKLSENELTSIKTLLNETQFSADLFEADLSFLSESQDFSILKEHFPFLSKKIFDVLKTKSASSGPKTYSCSFKENTVKLLCCFNNKQNP